MYFVASSRVDQRGESRAPRSAKRRAKAVDVSPVRSRRAARRYYVLLAKWNAKINLTRSSCRLAAKMSDRPLADRAGRGRAAVPETRAAARHGLRRRLARDPVEARVATICTQNGRVKTRKAVFLREAVRDLGLVSGGRNCAFEELLAAPELHEALDLVTIRAVRVEPRTLMTLQAFLRPGGCSSCFAGRPGRVSPTPHLLRSRGWRPIRCSIRSSAARCSKQNRVSAACVPRGTPKPARESDPRSLACSRRTLPRFISTYTQLLSR